MTGTAQRFTVAKVADAEFEDELLVRFWAMASLGTLLS